MPSFAARGQSGGIARSRRRTGAAGAGDSDRSPTVRSGGGDDATADELETDDGTRVELANTARAEQVRLRLVRNDFALGFDMIRLMRLRIARHTDRLQEVVAFYRDRVGFPEIGRFQNHDGYDGVFLEIPGTNTHLELTRGGDHPPPDPHPESLIVLFLESETAIDEIADRINQPPVVPANPYWRANARAYADPDGFQLLLALSA